MGGTDVEPGRVGQIGDLEPCAGEGTACEGSGPSAWGERAAHVAASGGQPVENAVGLGPQGDPLPLAGPRSQSVYHVLPEGANASGAGGE